MKELIPQGMAEPRIFVIRGQKVMLDRDLAALYGVTIDRFNSQVKKNTKRFPEDFMFQLTEDEVSGLKLQEEALSCSGLSKRPYVFTELGFLMLSSVIKSKTAVHVSIAIVRQLFG
ncbi:MAG: ORF6N domain-containing protein [Candidatus Omnitrophica bacterium]|nr:ORF6N domain-containing protein [Candidatus Omnitrophota bacterium]